MGADRGRPGLRSMTGFGSAKLETDDLRLEVEVRSVNHRHLKVSVRTPEGLAGLAPKIEERVRARFSRGTIYLTVRQKSDHGETAVHLDRELLIRLHRELTLAADDLGVAPPGLGEIALLPGVVREEESLQESAAIWPILQKVNDEALTALDAMRKLEGEGIGEDLLRHAADMLAAADGIESRLPAAVSEQAERLKARVVHLMADQAGPDGPDLAREIALLADKTDISEELQRLRSHVSQVKDCLSKDNGPVGRKLEFLAQELLREANTMASKSHDTELIGFVLQLKLAIERVREQVANLE